MRKGFIFLILILFNVLLLYGINQANILMFNNDFMIYLNEKDEPKDSKEDTPKEEDTIDTNYNGESIEQIGKRFDHYVKKTPLEGYGEYVAKVSISKGVNPYLIGAIILESSRCKTECSVIFKECNNVSGMKGSPGCFGGTYRVYDSINDAISDIVGDISKKFYTKEMQSPYKMYKDYGKNSSWAFKVSNYMDAIKRTK